MTLEERIRTLHNSAFFSVVPEPDLVVLAEAMHEEMFADGELIFEYGDRADRIYVVSTGELMAIVPGQEGSARKIGPGDLIGEYGLFEQGSRSATVTCQSAVTMLSMDYTRFREFLVTFPEATLSILGRTVKRLLVLESKSR